MPLSQIVVSLRAKTYYLYDYDYKTMAAGGTDGADSRGTGRGWRPREDETERWLEILFRTCGRQAEGLRVWHRVLQLSDEGKLDTQRGSVQY